VVCDKIERVTNGWFAIYMGKAVEDRSMVVHDEVNGQWELQVLMRRDKLGDMGCLVPMR
jgi:hypothetical protein